MRVRKKYVVQKSFRIDQRVEYDMSLLAELTNRSQNDLVNAAIEEFLQDNGKWFIENVIVEQYSPIFEYTGEDFKHHFKMGGVTVDLEDDKGYYTVKYKIEKDSKIVDKYEKSISISDEDAEDKLKSYLRYIATYIDIESEDSKQYLKKRMDYSDYTPVKKNKKR